MKVISFCLVVLLASVATADISPTTYDFSGNQVFNYTPAGYFNVQYSLDWTATITTSVYSVEETIYTALNQTEAVGAAFAIKFMDLEQKALSFCGTGYFCNILFGFVVNFQKQIFSPLRQLIDAIRDSLFKLTFQINAGFISLANNITNTSGLSSYSDQINQIIDNRFPGLSKLLSDYIKECNKSLNDANIQLDNYYAQILLLLGSSNVLNYVGVVISSIHFFILKPLKENSFFFHSLVTF